MGADIYLKSEYDKTVARYEPDFEAAVEERDFLKAAGRKDDAARAQENVEKYMNLMWSKGYFRDAYNEGNLLWTMGLSWWRDIGESTDEEGHLPVDRARWLLDELYKRHEQMLASIPEISAKAIKNGWDQYGESWDVDTLTAYFQSKWEQLTTLLRRSIELDEPLYCSV